jgi:hypothetical protein
LPFGLPSLLTVDFGSDDPGMLVKDPDGMLSTFQDRMASQVPFVVIPQCMTAGILRREKPFLYMAVMMVASFEDTGTQLALGRKGLEHMVERLILRGEKSMDLLQGLLIYLSWFVCRPIFNITLAERYLGITTFFRLITSLITCWHLSHHYLSTWA